MYMCLLYVTRDNSQDPSSSMTSKNNNENRVIYQQEEYEALVIRYCIHIYSNRHLNVLSNKHSII